MSRRALARCGVRQPCVSGVATALNCGSNQCRSCTRSSSRGRGKHERLAKDRSVMACRRPNDRFSHPARARASACSCAALCITPARCAFADLDPRHLARRGALVSCREGHCCRSDRDVIVKRGTARSRAASHRLVERQRRRGLQILPPAHRSEKSPRQRFQLRRTTEPLLRGSERATASSRRHRIEAIARADRVGIGRLHHVEPHQRADQHEQGRARQMEIGDQPVDRPEAIAGRDEDRGVALERLDRAVLVRRRFRAGAGWSCRPRSAARPPRATAFSRSAVAASIRPHSACILWLARCRRP